MEPEGPVHIDAERNGTEALGATLKAKVPSTWPPEFVEPPKQEPGAEWVSLYIVHEPEDGEATVIGVAGLARWTGGRTMQTGAALLPEWQDRGLGTEVMAALADHAMRQSDVLRIVCDIPAGHHGAAKCLRKAGYSQAQETPADGFARWEKRIG